MIHTIQKTISFVGKVIEDNLKRTVLEELKIYHMLDERLGEVDKEETFEQKQQERFQKLFYLIKAAELSEPDIILVACSTLSLEVHMLQESTKIPLVAIDESALEYCVDSEKKITVFATSSNPVEPVLIGMRALAEQKKKALSVEVVLCEEALPFLLQMNDVQYREKVLKAAQKLKGKELIYLAQGSTAVLQNQIKEICGCEVVSSIMFCEEELRQLLKKEFK